MTTDIAAAQGETEETIEAAAALSPLPSDLALLGWSWRGSQLFAPGIPLSICTHSFPPPECFNVARDQPWYRAEIGARWADAKKPKPKKVKRVAKQAEPVQEEMLL